MVESSVCLRGGSLQWLISPFGNAFSHCNSFVVDVMVLFVRLVALRFFLNTESGFFWWLLNRSNCMQHMRCAQHMQMQNRRVFVDDERWKRKDGKRKKNQKRSKFSISTEENDTRLDISRFSQTCFPHIYYLCNSVLQQAYQNSSIELFFFSYYNST